jgi:hypothetical protein
MVTVRLGKSNVGAPELAYSNVQHFLFPLRPRSTSSSPSRRPATRLPVHADRLTLVKPWKAQPHPPHVWSSALSPSDKWFGQLDHSFVRHGTSVPNRCISTFPSFFGACLNVDCWQASGSGSQRPRSPVCCLVQCLWLPPNRINDLMKFSSAWLQVQASGSGSQRPRSPVCCLVQCLSLPLQDEGKLWMTGDALLSTSKWARVAGGASRPVRGELRCLC